MPFMQCGTFVSELLEDQACALLFGMCLVSASRKCGLVWRVVSLLSALKASLGRPHAWSFPLLLSPPSLGSRQRP